jgi:hypothetical protein
VLFLASNRTRMAADAAALVDRKTEAGHGS